MTRSISLFSFFFFFNDTATTEIYTLSLHDALPIWIFVLLFSRLISKSYPFLTRRRCPVVFDYWEGSSCKRSERSEEHTSELQSRRDLVCRLLLEKKKKKKNRKVIKLKSQYTYPYLT